MKTNILNRPKYHNTLPTTHTHTQSERDESKMSEGNYTEDTEPQTATDGYSIGTCVYFNG